MPLTFITERDGSQQDVEKEKLYVSKFGYQDDRILDGR